MRSFVEEIIMRNKALKKLKPNDVTIFNVKGNFGSYQIKICAVDEKFHSRPVEINGEIHHLFVTKDVIAPLPTHDEINHNMRGTVIMKDITIHLFDEKGDGIAVRLEQSNGNGNGAHARKLINLAGEKGVEFLNNMETTGRLANDTYHIVQEDILKSFK